MTFLDIFMVSKCLFTDCLLVARSKRVYSEETGQHLDWMIDVKITIRGRQIFCDILTKSQITYGNVKPDCTQKETQTEESNN